MKRALKWGFSKKKEVKEGERIKRCDDVTLKIYQMAGDSKKDRVDLASGEGNWLSHLMIDGKTFWRIEQEVPLWKARGDSKTMSDGTMILPSDSDWRPDI